MTMGVATDGLNRLFSNRLMCCGARCSRDRRTHSALKAMFIREAAGFTGDVPKLLRGEGL